MSREVSKTSESRNNLSFRDCVPSVRKNGHLVGDAAHSTDPQILLDGQQVLRGLIFDGQFSRKIKQTGYCSFLLWF